MPVPPRSEAVVVEGAPNKPVDGTALLVDPNNDVALVVVAAPNVGFDAPKSPVDAVVVVGAPKRPVEGVVVEPNKDDPVVVALVDAPKKLPVPAGALVVALNIDALVVGPFEVLPKRLEPEVVVAAEPNTNEPAGFAPNSDEPAVDVVVEEPKSDGAAEVLLVDEPNIESSDVVPPPPNNDVPVVAEPPKIEDAVVAAVPVVDDPKSDDEVVEAEKNISMVVSEKVILTNFSALQLISQ
ncbi:hypothetical protein V3C99_005579 [Haemonchus contortus]